MSAFKNEYVPKPGEEKSEFFLEARRTLQSKVIHFDKWTVDRQSNMVLVRAGRGRDEESAKHEYWRFHDGERVYSFYTELIEKRELSGKVIHLERRIVFYAPGPDASLLPTIRSALQAYADYGVVSNYESCELVLRDANGKVI
jgi:hypothetical protein